MTALPPFSVHPTRVLRVLMGIILVLAVLSVLGQYATFVLHRERLLGFVPEFDLSRENNIPTYFSALMLLSAALLLALIAHLAHQTNAAFHRHWLALSGIFAYLSVDEITSLHERLGEPVRTLVDPSGPFTYAWVLPGIALLAVFLVAYTRFFLHLSGRRKVLFGLSGGLYVLGGLGFELVGGWYASHHGVTFTLSLLTTVEEVLEMGGVALFLYTLLDYLRARTPALTVSFAPSPPAPH